MSRVYDVHQPVTIMILLIIVGKNENFGTQNHKTKTANIAQAKKWMQKKGVDKSEEKRKCRERMRTHTHAHNMYIPSEHA